MNIRLARIIDFWVGIPVSICLSLVCKMHAQFAAFFTKKAAKESPPKKILLLELSEMGSAILAYSTMKKLGEMYPDAELYFWIFAENAESVHILDSIPEERVLTTRSKNLGLILVDTLKNLWKLRRVRVDVIIDMELFSRFTSILTYLSGAKTRVGFYRYCLEGLYRADIYTHRVMYNPYLHISKNFLSLALSLEESPSAPPLLKRNLSAEKTAIPEILSTDKDKTRIFNKLKTINTHINERNKIVILNPGIGEFLFLRKWPVRNYIHLTEKLLQDENIFVILIGLKPEAKDLRKLIYMASHDRVINLIGQTSVKELVDLCNVSRLFISHDSGAANIASLSGIDIMILFGPETPLLYEPLTPNKKIFYKNLACSPCYSAYNHRESTCRYNRCLREISVDEVYKAAREYLV